MNALEQNILCFQHAQMEVEEEENSRNEAQQQQLLQQQQHLQQQQLQIQQQQRLEEDHHVKEVSVLTDAIKFPTNTPHKFSVRKFF